FVLSGVSKICALPQMKLGWIAAGGPPQWRDRALDRLEVIADTYLSVASPIQRALPALLAGRDRIQRQVLERVRSNLRTLDRLLETQPLCSRLPVEGGWTVVLRVPQVLSDDDRALELLERDGVLIHPGHFFGFAREGYLVASLIVAEETVGEGMKRMLARIRDAD